jgi:putative RNA 2'-phosphotransferase
LKKQHIKISKFLSYVLRHKPEAIGLTLDPEGWAWVDDLIACAARHGRKLDRNLIAEVVAGNDKRRFAMDSNGIYIRANQGHSIPVDLGLQPVLPPETLFHGTAASALPSIRKTGLQSRRRQHVHLSPDRQTAIKVGRRHGKPVILKVHSGAMNRAGHQFYLSQNGVWLVDQVPPEFLEEEGPSKAEEAE